MQYPSGAFDVKAFLNERSMSMRQWGMLLVCFLILMIDGAQTSAIAFVAPALAREMAISALALGPVLSAALIGLGAGALLAGPIADRIGRKRVLIGSIVIFSFWSLVTTGVHSVAMLLVIRFLTGLGVGAAMPNCTTLASEFLPAKQRGLLLNLMFCGFPLGASAGGFVSAWLIPHYGWRSVFLVGGIAPLLVATALLRVPESIVFMTVRHWPAEKIKAALRWVAGEDSSAIATIERATSFAAHEVRSAGGPSPLRTLLASDYLSGTLMLWLTYFMGLLLYFLLTSWMPTLLQDGGFSVARAAAVAALFPLGGGIGALICGWLMDRTNPTLVVSAAYLLTGLLLVGLAHSTESMSALMWMTFLSGTAMNGAQSSMPVLAAAFYPTQCRASGVAWMMGVGRFGGVFGALIGGVLLHAGYNMSSIVEGLSVVALIATTALIYKNAVDRDARQQSSFSPGD